MSLVGHMTRKFSYSKRIARQQKRQTVASLPALGPWAPPAERGPSLKSIYRVSLTVDLCKGNKIISLKKNYFTTASWGPRQKEKKYGGPGHVPSVPIG